MPDLEIKQQLVTFQNSYPSNTERVAICEHVMDGYMTGTYARFNNPKEKVSAHFGVSLEGETVQYVPLDRWAYANGVLEATPNLSIDFIKYCWLNRMKANPPNPNWYTFSIEHEGRPGQVFPEKQYQATLSLHRFLMAANPLITPDRQHLIGHCDISPKSRANCPSATFPFNRLIADLKGVPTQMPLQVPGNIPVRNSFTLFWWQQGGLPIFGYPITAEIPVPTGLYGLATVIQYFERARFELQPDGKVFLGLVGSEALKGDERFERGLSN